MSSYFVDETSIVDKKVKIGEGTKIWHFCHIMGGVVIGKNCTVGQNVFIGRGVKIGNNVSIQNNVSVYDGVTLEDGVFCGPSCVFTNDLTPRALYSKGGKYIKTKVKAGATIGANATIVCGIELGENCFIGAGAVVTKNIPPNALAYGNPARVKGRICRCGIKINGSEVICAWCKKDMGEKPPLDDNGTTRSLCAECQKEYLRKEGFE